MPTFAALGKSGWPRMGISLFVRTTVYMRGQTPTRPAKWVWPAGRLLSRRRERRQRGAKGVPPWNPRPSAGFLFRKTGRSAGTGSKEVQKGGPRPPGTGLVINYSISLWDGGYLFLPCSIASKGPGCTHPGPFLRIWRGQEAASLSLSLSLLSRGRFSRPEDSSGSGSSGGGVTSICTRSIRLSSILRTVKVTFS